MKLFNLLNLRKQSLDNYFKNIIEENKQNMFSFQKKYSNQESKLLRMYGNSNTYNKR